MWPVLAQWWTGDLRQHVCQTAEYCSASALYSQHIFPSEYEGKKGMHAHCPPVLAVGLCLQLQTCRCCWLLLWAFAGCAGRTWDLEALPLKMDFFPTNFVQGFGLRAHTRTGTGTHTQYPSMHAHMHAWACTHACTHHTYSFSLSLPPSLSLTHTHTHTHHTTSHHTHTHTHTHTNTHTYTHTNTHTYTHTYTHTRAPPPPHTHTHTHTHAHAHVLLFHDWCFLSVWKLYSALTTQVWWALWCAVPRKLTDLITHCACGDEQQFSEVCYTKCPSMDAFKKWVRGAGNRCGHL